MKKIFFMLKHTLKCLHYINAFSMFLFFSRTQCRTVIVLSRSNTYSCWSLSDDRWLFTALMWQRSLCLWGISWSQKSFWHSKPQHATNKTGTLWYKRKCQLLALFIPNIQEIIYKCNRKRFELPSNHSWSFVRVCTRASAIYYIYQWFKSISNIK